MVEEECPEPKDGEVRVRVLAAGVALPDLLMREGVHPETPPLPFTPGWDLILEPEAPEARGRPEGKARGPEGQSPICSARSLKYPSPTERPARSMDG